MQADDTTVCVPLRARDGSVRAYALIDAADAEWVNQWTWHLSAGRYAARSERRLRYGRMQRLCVYLHRSVMRMRIDDDHEVDHINRNTLDCRTSNLRIIPHDINTQNLSPRTGKTSPYRGVHLYKPTGRWAAVITVHGKQIHLGYFSTEEEAAESARAARMRLMVGATD